MLIEQYRLETNPFAAERVRPFFSSHSSRYAGTKIARLLGDQIHCLGLSGAAGVGKTTLLRQQLRTIKNINLSWVKPGTEDPVSLLQKLIRDLGPGFVEGTATELRNILQVFLKHQAGNGRRSLIVADGVEHDSADVLGEIEALSRLRLRGRSVIQLIVATRNEDLITNFVSQQESGPLARALHQALSGFTLEETRAYLRACLHGAGCPWFDELVPDEVVVDTQSFTQGVIGDIDALLCGALELLAARATNAVGQPRLTPGLLREIAGKLHLKYDAAAWKVPTDETLSPEAVHLSDPTQLRIEAARLLVSSGGHLVAEVSLNRPRMVLGRDTSCDISLDSSYVSRYQNLFMETSEGWMLIDLNSTNGCFVNGRKVSEHHLRDGDLISVGQHQLRFTGPNGALAEALEGTQRARPAEPGQGAPAAGAAVTELRRDSVVRRG